MNELAVHLIYNMKYELYILDLTTYSEIIANYSR